jgi:hypothetical protein
VTALLRLRRLACLFVSLTRTSTVLRPHWCPGIWTGWGQTDRAGVLLKHLELPASLTVLLAAAKLLAGLRQQLAALEVVVVVVVVVVAVAMVAALVKR